MTNVCMQLPLIRLDQVFHLGTLNSADQRRNAGTSSLEGNCLSVSLCPNAWLFIAELGGSDLHSLTTAEAYFLDMVAIKADTDLLAAIVEWAIAEKLARNRQLWKAWYFDPDVEEWRYFECQTEQEAIEDASTYSVQRKLDLRSDQLTGPNGGPVVEPFTAITGSSVLAKLTGMQARGAQDGDVIDAVIMAWTMKKLPLLITEPVHGLWWNETYDPDSLSAPRGSIFPSFVEQWAATPSYLDAIEDIEEPLNNELIKVGTGQYPRRDER